MGESITSIICPECGAERRSEKGVRPGMTVRCHKCRASFVPLPLLDDDDAALPPPPLPGVGPRRKSIAKKELHGNFHHRFEGSRHSAMIVGSILLAGVAGLLFSIYRQTQEQLDITQRDVEKARQGLVDNQLRPGKPHKPKALAAPKEAPVARKPEQAGQKAVASAPPPVAPAPVGPVADDRMVIKPLMPLAPARASSIAPTSSFVQAAPDLAAQRKARAAAQRAAFEKAAQAKLDRARKLENDGKILGPKDLYREILNEFPDTAAAKIAKERFDELQKKSKK